MHSEHHGLRHGLQVRDACLKLLAQLTEDEADLINLEGLEISSETPLLAAQTAIEIAAIFHDCGRYNDKGDVIKEEQINHHLLSAERALQYCEFKYLESHKRSVEEAILCHDFQTKEITPHLNAPELTIAKIVQSADQMGWFHPQSIQRTVKYNEDIGIPFFDARLSLAERRRWNLSVENKNMVTIMLHQLYGYRGPQRFGIKAARLKVETYRQELKAEFLMEAEKRGYLKEVDQLISNFPA